MFHDHHIFPMPAQEKNELSSHPGQLQRTHCVQCVEGGVIPRGRNAAIFRGASVTHPCKGRHAPGKTGRENGSTDISTLSFQSTSSAQTKFHYYMHESSALLLLLFKKKIWSSSAVHPDIFSRKYLKLNPLKTLLHSFHTLHQLLLSKLKVEKRWKELLVVTPPLKPPSPRQSPSYTADHRTARANIPSPPCFSVSVACCWHYSEWVPETPADKGRLCLH